MTIRTFLWFVHRDQSQTCHVQDGSLFLVKRNILLNKHSISPNFSRYNSAFGSPVAKAQGIGYVQELIARLTHTPIETHNSSTNATLDNNPITFPLGHSLYVDATHEVVLLNSV